MARVISKDGTSIAFEKTGTGDPLIVVDGALCSRAFGPTAKLVPLLASRFSVITFDRRGRNESSDTSPYSVQREVEDIEALIKEAGGSAYLLGFSSGAALILNAAAAGLPIKKQLLYEPPYIRNMGGHNPPADSLGQLKSFIASEQRGKAVTFFMKDMVGVPAVIAYIMRITPVWGKLKAVAHTLPYDAAILGDFTIPVNLAADVKVPTMVMGGAKSPVGLYNSVQHLAKAIPNAQSKYLEGQTHNVSMKVIAPEVINYFR
jgi:pimeloyl-ACP methyl ester carboxylesterase